MSHSHPRALTGARVFYGVGYYPIARSNTQKYDHTSNPANQTNYTIMKTTTRRLLPFLLTAAALAFLATICNTIRGAGRDVEATGNNIQQATR
jgi:predicted small secreted protein